MPTRNIACLNCGCAGMLDARYENDVAQGDRTFKHLGHNPYSGDLHYQCPACKVILLVDPMAALGEKSLKGYPEGLANLSLRQRNGHRAEGWVLTRLFNRTESRA